MRFSNEFGFCDLNPFPGCNSLVISNHAFIYKKHRGQGRGDNNHKLRLKRAKEMGYSAMVCTVAANNGPQLAIMKKNDWKKVFEFYSQETEHYVEMWAKEL